MTFATKSQPQGEKQPMANQYLIEIHNYITSKIGDAQKAKKVAVQKEDPAQISHFNGQLDQLGALRRFLKEHYDLPTQSYY